MTNAPAGSWQRATAVESRQMGAQVTSEDSGLWGGRDHLGSRLNNALVSKPYWLQPPPPTRLAPSLVGLTETLLNSEPSGQARLRGSLRRHGPPSQGGGARSFFSQLPLKATSIPQFPLPGSLFFWELTKPPFTPVEGASVAMETASGGC